MFLDRVALIYAQVIKILFLAIVIKFKLYIIPLSLFLGHLLEYTYNIITYGTHRYYWVFLQSKLHTYYYRCLVFLGYIAVVPPNKAADCIVDDILTLSTSPKGCYLDEITFKTGVNDYSFFEGFNSLNICCKYIAFKFLWNTLKLLFTKDFKLNTYVSSQNTVINTLHLSTIKKLFKLLKHICIADLGYLWRSQVKNIHSTMIQHIYKIHLMGGVLVFDYNRDHKDIITLDGYIEPYGYHNANLISGVPLFCFRPNSKFLNLSIATGFQDVWDIWQNDYHYTVNMFWVYLDHQNKVVIVFTNKKWNNLLLKVGYEIGHSSGYSYHSTERHVSDIYDNVEMPGYVELEGDTQQLNKLQFNCLINTAYYNTYIIIKAGDERDWKSLVINTFILGADEL